MRAKLFASQDARLTFPAKGSAYLQPSASTRTFQTIQPPRGKTATIFWDGLFLLMGELTSLMVKQQLVGAPSPSHPMEGDEVIHIYINTYISCLARSLPLRRISPMYELDSIPRTLQNSRVSLRLLGPIGPVARDSQAWIFHDSKHAANMCLGMIQSRTNVSFGLDQSMTPAPSPIEAAYDHTASLQSWAQCGE